MKEKDKGRKREGKGWRGRARERKKVLMYPLNKVLGEEGEIRGGKQNKDSE